MISHSCGIDHKYLIEFVGYCLVVIMTRVSWFKSKYKILFLFFCVIHVEHLSNFYLRISLQILSFHHYYYHRIFQTLNENSCRDLTSSLKLNFEELNTDTIIRTQFTVFDKQNQIKYNIYTICIQDTNSLIIVKYAMKFSSIQKACIQNIKIMW